MKRFLIAGIAAFAAALVITAVGVVRAHSHDFWINKGKYVGPDNVHCCGPKDCFQIADEDVRTTPQGFVLKTYNNEPVPFHEATPAEPDPDGVTRYWRCQKPDGTRRCFFAPYGGS
jgi:hypothetical protein